MADRIPVEQAEFFYRAEPGKMPTEMVVARRDLRMAEFNSTGVDATRSFPQSMGAHVSGWMGGAAVDTPAGIFARLYLSRLPERVAVAEALREFGRIEGQEWATTMADALDEFDRRTR